MKNRIRCLIAFTIGIVITFQGCKKELNQEIKTNHKTVVDPSLVFRKPETPEEKNLVLNLEKITDILKEVYKNREALKEVNAAIQAKIYTDESILIGDLIFLENGVLNNSNSFQKLKSQLSISQGTFSTSFWKLVQKKNDSGLNAFLNQVNDQITSQKKKGVPQIKNYSPFELTIYYPYSEQYINPYDNSGNYSPETSVMTATADADEGYGWKPVFDSNGNMGYTQVVINDDYAYANPTHIIGINGVEPSYFDTSGSVSIFPPGSAIQVPNLPREVHQVFVGEVRCNQQYDRLISFSGNGGGSEIRFTRADGFLKQVDGQVQQADVYVIDGKAKVERGDIRNSNWVDWTVTWDADWENDNKEQNLAIYEDDNRNAQTLNISVKTTVKLSSNVNGEGTVGGTLSFKSDDDIIRQNNHKFDTFFPTNRFASFPEELRNGWLVYGTGGAVAFTLPDKKLIP